jgi:alcohol dehydrogenase
MAAANDVARNKVGAIQGVTLRAIHGGAMKALVYYSPGRFGWETRLRPRLHEAGDALVRITTTTICGTDLHILQGDVPTVREGRVLGHEGVGVVEEVGSGVAEFKVGDRVIVSCITACLKCDPCLREMYSHCVHGGWMLGNRIDGTHAEHVRIPQADGSLHHVPEGGDEEALVMLSDVLPTGFECGVLNGRVRPGSSVAIVGAGPIGLGTLLTAQFYSPGAVYVVDVDDRRLAAARELGATAVVNSRDGQAASRLMELTGGVGVDTAIEAVGVPETFGLCQEILAAGGCLANIGVHGRPVTLHLEKLWDRNVTITTRLVDTVTTPKLLNMIVAGRLKPKQLVTHRFALDAMMKAYGVYANAGEAGALKVVLRA